MSECENNVDLHSSYKHCDLSNYEKLLHPSPIDLLIVWDQYVGIAHYKRKPGVALALSLSFESLQLTVQPRFPL